MKEEKIWFCQYQVTIGKKSLGTFRTKIQAKTQNEAQQKLERFLETKLTFTTGKIEEGLTEQEQQIITESIDQIIDAVTKVAEVVKKDKQNPFSEN